MKYRIELELDDSGVFVVTCPALPGVVTQGATREEAVANARDAIMAYLESLIKAGDPVPAPVTEDVVDIDLSSIEGAA